jgi:hypothetical protein
VFWKKRLQAVENKGRGVQKENKEAARIEGPRVKAGVERAVCEVSSR